MDLTEKKSLYQQGYRPAGYRQAVHPQHGMANITEDDYRQLKIDEAAGHEALKLEAIALGKEMYTCQICERLIRAKAGILAHHGYKRPGDGWQTESCMGARNLPYEVSCDMLPPAILAIKRWIQSRKEWLANFEKNPPEKLYRERNYGPREEYDRPEGFKASDALEHHGGFSHKEQYALKYNSDHYHAKKGIEYAEGYDLPRLEKRLADWKPAK